MKEDITLSWTDTKHSIVDSSLLLNSISEIKLFTYLENLFWDDL